MYTDFFIAMNEYINNNKKQVFSTNEAWWKNIRDFVESAILKTGKCFLKYKIRGYCASRMRSLGMWVLERFAVTSKPFVAKMS